MRTLILSVVIALLTATVALAVGPIATDGNALIQTMRLSRNSAGTMANRCDTVAASGTVTYAVGNTSAIRITATDASYNGITVTRKWDSDTAWMPIFSTDTLVPGAGLKTVTVTNVTTSNAIICIERQVAGDGSP